MNARLGDFNLERDIALFLVENWFSKVSKNNFFCIKEIIPPYEGFYNFDGININWVDIG